MARDDTRTEVPDASGIASIHDADRIEAAHLAQALLSRSGGRIRRIVLFGSRAWGTAGPESDFDFLVVEADPVSCRAESARLRAGLQELGSAPVDVWVMGETEFEETRNVVGGLAHPAHKYGLVLYEDA
jgi:predicted nucleotidyltransferase